MKKSDSARNVEAYEGLVDAIYQAAVDPQAWSTVLVRIADAVHSAGTTLWTHDFSCGGVHADGEAEKFRAVRFAPEALESYASHYSQTNVWVANEDTLKPGRVVTSSLLFPDEQLPSTEFFGDWLRPQDLFFSIGGVLARNGALAVKLSALRSRNKGPYSSSELQFLGRLYPHIRRACELNQRLESAAALERDAALGHGALSVTHLGIIVLGSAGRVLHTNRKADQLLRAGTTLVLRQGQLHAGSAGRDAALMAAIRSAAQQRRPVNLHLGDAVLADNFCLTLMPMPRAGILLSTAGIEASVVCLISTGSGQRAATIAQLRELFGLTPAEARVVRNLVNGESLAEVAQAQGLSRNTVKTQLHSAMSKTGTASQRAMIRLLLSIPAVREHGL
ncbi:helix-turn-helix transcriptional regulator [Paucibacter soli]|uniref:helix-turn-helix transcriptional regulator n=1 Tax=Paucibacter soli TaxID=3133433 RepID=UPI003099EEB1